MAAAEFLGIKYATVLAGFAGGIVSLSFTKPLTRVQMGMAVLTGAITATYLTPIVMGWAGRWMTVGSEMENGFAFLVGLTAMNLIPGVIALSELFRRRPRLIFAPAVAVVAVTDKEATQ